MTVLLGAAPSIIGPSDVGAWMAAKGAPGAAALLDFAGSKYGFRSAAGVPRWGSVAADMAFARASAAGRWRADGVYEMAGSGVLRYDHDPVTREPLGALIEGSRTNLLIGSDGRRGFTPSGTSPPATALATRLDKACAAITFPAGLSAAGWAVSRAVYPAQTYPFPNAYSWSYKLSTNRPLLSGEGFTVMLNGSFATAGVNFTSANDLTQWAQRSVPNITYGSTLNAGLYPAVTNVTTLGEPLTVYITDMQMELGPGPSSYVPTEVSAATRATDNLSMSLPVVPANGFTITFRAHMPRYGNAGDANVLFNLMPAASTANRIGIDNFGSSGQVWMAFPGGAGTYRLALGVALGSEFYGAFAWSAARGWRGTALGGAVVSVTSQPGPVADLARMTIGSRAGAAPWGSTIKRFGIWPHCDFTDDQMRSLAAA